MTGMYSRQVETGLFADQGKSVAQQEREKRHEAY